MDNNSINILIDNLDSVNDNSIPPWGLMLLKCTKGVINGLKVIDDLSQRNNNLEDFKTINETITRKLHDENQRLNAVITKLEMRIDDQEQRSRSMYLHGVEENAVENTDELVLHITIEV